MVIRLLIRFFWPITAAKAAKALTQDWWNFETPFTQLIPQIAHFYSGCKGVRYDNSKGFANSPWGRPPYSDNVSTICAVKEQKHPVIIWLWNCWRHCHKSFVHFLSFLLILSNWYFFFLVLFCCFVYTLNVMIGLLLLLKSRENHSHIPIFTQTKPYFILPQDFILITSIYMFSFCHDRHERQFSSPAFTKAIHSQVLLLLFVHLDWWIHVKLLIWLSFVVPPVHTLLSDAMICQFSFCFTSRMTGNILFCGSS